MQVRRGNSMRLLNAPNLRLLALGAHPSMYSTCLYCNHRLGRNDVIETFPVGRRLAFDQDKGRLWVVCRKCEKWNLTPFEERWEAIEDCERRFRDAKKRVASDNIGLAKLDEGLELVRIGAPLRPEFAAWRYGDQFGRRKRRAILIGTGAAAAVGGVLVAGAMSGVLTGGGYGIWQAMNAAYTTVKRKRIVARISTPMGQRLTVRGAHVERARLLPPGALIEDVETVPRGGDAGAAWGLLLPHAEGEATFYGDDARRVTALIMPKVNAGGATRKRVQEAVELIERSGDPGNYLERIARREHVRPDQVHLSTSTERKLVRGAVPVSFARSRRGDSLYLTKMDLWNRLAIEMAVNEENERIALQGDLALLELEWKEAEELAAIADRLGTPEEVDVQLAVMRQRAGFDHRD
jgi:hypothetical protein